MVNVISVEKGNNTGPRAAAWHNVWLCYPSSYHTQCSGEVYRVYGVAEVLFWGKLFPEYCSVMASPGLIVREHWGKCWKRKAILFFSCFSQLKNSFTWLFSLYKKLPKKNHLRRKVLNIFPGISYHTEKWTNLLSLSECFEARKEVVIHQKQFYYEIWFMLRKINDDVKMCTSAWREHILVNWVIQFYYFKKIHIWLFFLF